MVSARTVLWVLSFWGFAVNYMVRINVNIGIVSMVKPPMYELNKTSYCRTGFNSSKTLSENKRGGEFSWDEKMQSHVLGGYYWLHGLLQIPGGLLARRWGTKALFGLGNAIPSGILFLAPLAARLDYRLLVALRVLQGFLSGVVWPSMHNMVAQWIPPNERSKFMSSYFGSSIGVAITYPLCGFLIDHYGWESVFYVTGGLGMVWYAFWLYYVFDSPGQHPRISDTERRYIEKCIGDSYKKEKLAIPWRSLLTSWPVWVMVIAQWGGTWGLFTLMTQTPTYLTNIIGFDLTLVGIYSGIPHILRFLFAFSFAMFCDHLLSRGLLSATKIRKIATFISVIGQGIMFLLLAFCGCNETLAVLISIIAIGIHGAYSTGPLATAVDISPNFAGVTQGVAGMFCITTGTVSSFIVGLLTYQNQTLEQWQKVFYISSAIMILSGGIYILFSKSKIQDWNSPTTKETTKEMEPLK